MPIFRRANRVVEEQNHGPTTAEIREARAREWDEHFSGPSDREDYRKGFLRYSPLFWDIVQSTQRDLLRLLVGRVPAELGVPAIFALTVVYGDQLKADEAARATLATIVNELQPGHARTLLVALADAWHNSERSGYEERGKRVTGEFDLALRRLTRTTAEETGAISSIRAWIDFREEFARLGDDHRG